MARFVERFLCTMNNNSRYYRLAFFWSTFSRLLNAAFGFFSVPILLGYFGKADYGILSIATACNGYMSLMDLGMNTGIVKFVSQWKAEGKYNLINRVVRTNISFYMFVSVINATLLLLLAFYGKSFFSIDECQFSILRSCLIILALFSPMSWITTVFNQVLISFGEILYTQIVSCILVIFKLCLIIACVLQAKLSIVGYFFALTLLISACLIPYSWRCKQKKYIDSILPAFYWEEFRIVLNFSLALFALSIFQVTATQLRPIILSVFSLDGASVAADFRIIEVMPQFIIMLSGSFLSIFLPKATEIYSTGCVDDIRKFVNTWTLRVSIIICFLCFPFLISPKSLLGAYVGANYGYLSKWLALWLAMLFVQLHSSPAYSMIMASGKTKVLVWSSALACTISVLINILLAKKLAVGSAVIGYSIYLIIQNIFSYMYYYKKVLDLDIIQVLASFLKPVFVALLCCFVFVLIDLRVDDFSSFNVPERARYIFVFSINSFIWMVLFSATLFVFKIVNVDDIKLIVYGKR